MKERKKERRKMAPASHHHITVCSIQPLKRGEEAGRYLPPYATVSFQDRCVVKSKALENLTFFLDFHRLFHARKGRVPELSTQPYCIRLLFVVITMCLSVLACRIKVWGLVHALQTVSPVGNPPTFPLVRSVSPDKFLDLKGDSLPKNFDAVLEHRLPT